MIEGMSRSMQLRQDIIAAARHLFDEQGYESTTLEHVAERLGLAVDLVIRFFYTKDALLEAVWSE